MDVYIIKKGRVLDDDDPPVKDVIAVGLQQLTHGKTNPLKQYNKEFARLQARRRLIPVVPVVTEDEVTERREAETAPAGATTPSTVLDPAEESVVTATSADPCLTSMEAHSQEVQDNSELCNTPDPESEPEPEPGESSSDSEGSEEEEEEEKSELERLLEEIDGGNEDQSLPRESSYDVSLDMDGDQENDDIDDVEPDSDASEVD